MNVPDWSLKELHLFQLVIETGTVTAAAARLGMSQSAASRMLSGFEAKTGQILFERVGRSLLPTVAARALVGQAEAILDAATSTGSGAAETGMMLCVGAPPAFAEGFIAEAIAAFAGHMPQCRVRLEVMSTPRILDSINEGVLDLGISDAPLRHPNLRSLPFHEASLCCFAAPGTRLAGLQTARIEDVWHERLIFLTRRHASRTFVERQLLAAGLDMKPHFEASSAHAALWLAHHLGGVAMLAPFPLIRYLPVPLKPVPFQTEFRYSAQFVIPAKIAPNLPVRAFMRSVRDLINRRDDEGR